MVTDHREDQHASPDAPDAGQVIGKHDQVPMTARGVVVERTGLARNRIWQHTGILGVLDDYADAIRRSFR